MSMVGNLDKPAHLRTYLTYFTYFTQSTEFLKNTPTRSNATLTL